LRALVAFLIVVVASASAGAATVADWWRALSAEERYGVQADLVLVGIYDGFVDGTFGPRTEAALSRFQQTSTSRQPVSSISGRADLRRHAQEVFDQMGMALEQYAAEDVAAYVPRSILTLRQEGKGGGVSFSSPDGGISLYLSGWDDTGAPLADLAANITRPSANRTVTYSSIQDHRVVVSGRQDGFGYYSVLFVDSPKIVGVSVLWSDSYATEGAITATFSASYSGRIESFAELEEQPSPDQPALDQPSPDQPASGDEGLSKDGQRFGPFILPDSTDRAIILAGEIETGAMLEFRRALKARPTADIIVLDSIGGSVNEGLLLAHEVAERGLATYVPYNATCMSACAYVFFAGKSRAADGPLGVHQIYGEGVSASDAQVVLSDVLDALAEFDVPQEVISVMLRTRPEQMHVFTADEMALLQLNRGYLDRAALFGPEAVGGLTVMPKNTDAEEAGLGRTERLLSVTLPVPVDELLSNNGFTPKMIEAVDEALAGSYPYPNLPSGATCVFCSERPALRTSSFPTGSRFTGTMTRRAMRSTSPRWRLRTEAHTWRALSRGASHSPTTSKRAPLFRTR
jgi:hypothetical protein